jgi:hypothetical protein
VSISPPLRAIDLKPLRDALYGALATNSTIAGLIGTNNIFWVADMTATASDYIVLTLLAYVPANVYDRTQGCAHVQITAVSQGSPDDARTLRAAVQTAVLDTAWAIAGYDLLDAKLAAGLPDQSPLDQGKVIFAERDRFEVIIRRQ